MTKDQPKLIKHQPAGILMVEIIVAIAVFVLLAAGAIYFLSATVFSAQTTTKRSVAASYLQEGVEAVQAVDREAWNYLADTPDNEYGLDNSTGTWQLTSDPDNPHGDTNYTRTVAVADVYRNTTGDIVASDDTEAVLDPHTREITVTIDWLNGNITSTIDSTVLLTDWDASIIIDDTQSDFGAGTLSNVRISAIDDGELQIIQQPMEVGTTTASTSWATITLENEYTNPVVVASVLDGNNPNSPVSVRVRNASATSFDVRLDFPTDNFVPVTTNNETIYYMVVESGIWTLGDNGTKIEAGIVEDVSILNCSSCGWNNGEDMVYEQAYSSSPIVFHQIMSENDANWVTSFVSDDASNTNPPGTDGFQVAMNGAQVTTSHSAEDIGYIVIDSNVEDVFEGIDFETDATGDIVQGYSNPRHTETFDQTYSSAPWAMATQLTVDGGDGAWAMIDSISSTAMSVYVEEDQTSDTERSHTTEDVGMVIMAETGTYYLDSAEETFDYPKMELGVIEPESSGATGFMEIGTTTASTSWSTVSLTETYTDPVVVVSVLDGNNPNSPVSVRVRNASATSFDVRLDFPTDNFAPSTTNSETVYYTVVESGTWTLGDGSTKLEAGIVEDVSQVACAVCAGGAWEQGVSVSYDHTYATSPLVFHQVMSENSANWITSYVSSPTSRANPPTTSGFRVAMNAAQVTTSHSAEDIGYIVVERDVTDTADGVDFETDLTADTVLGHFDARYTEAFDNTYASAPWVLSSQLEMDGSDGSWSMIDAVSATQITLYEDEDQQTDSERSHTTETHAFLAFASTGSFELSDGAISTDPITVNLQQTYDNPVVVTLPYFLNDTNSPASIRVYDVESTAFTMRFDFPTDNFAPTDSTWRDDVYYVVMEAGQWQMGDTHIEAHIDSVSTVNYNPNWTAESKTYDHTYDDPPIVLHQVMSDDDPDWITSWASATSGRSAPPTETGFQLGLLAAQVTASQTHGPESVGWIAIENTGIDTYDGVEFLTSFQANAMLGHSNACNPFTYGASYTSPIVLASQAAINGADGSWISLCDQTTTTLGFHAEEDQYTDSERSHTNEDYGVLIFEELFDAPGGPNTSNQTSGTYESDALGDGSTQRNFNIIEWAEQTDCTNCNVAVQVRAADTVADLASETYVGPDGTNATEYDAPEGDLLPTNLIGKLYLQYFITLTGTTAESPRLDDSTTTDYEN